MSKCKWCEEIINNSTDFCNGFCLSNFEHFHARKIIVQFAQDMEKKMQEKDKLNYTWKDKSIEFLVDKLNEERAEVDFELTILPSDEIKKELLHEAIMTMLVGQRIKDYGKYAKYEE